MEKLEENDWMFSKKLACKINEIIDFINNNAKL